MPIAVRPALSFEQSADFGNYSLGTSQRSFSGLTQHGPVTDTRGAPSEPLRGVRQ